MNIHNLKEYIINNNEVIEPLLEASGFKNISYNSSRSEYRASWDEKSNPTSVSVNENTLSAKCFSKDIKGDIIVLIENKIELSLRETLKFIAEEVGFSDNSTYIKPELPFGGFFNEILLSGDNEYGDLETYKEEILNDYLILPSSKFLKDGISYDTQVKYKIGYDLLTNRIIIPWRNLSGEIIGIMGRLNKDKLEEYESKYLPIIKFPKSKVLFGFYENYNVIQEKEFVIIFESEKSVMRLDSMGIYTTIALGGSSLSPFQSNNIKSLFPKKIIVALDEGMDEIHSYKLASQLKMDTFFNNEVFYIYDSENKYLPKGSKMSPGDLNLENFKKLIKECIKKI